MKKTMLTAFIVLCSIGTVHAQSMNKTDNGTSPGTTGAMGNVPNTGVATDPGAVKAQQGRSSNASPGTVGAAPGASTPSQTPK